MGINIIYEGRLADIARGPELVSAVRKLCDQMKWSLRTVEQLREDGHLKCKGLSGISVQTHPQAEWLHLHWDPQGQLVNHFYYALVHDKERCAAFTQLMQDNARRVQELLTALEAEDSGAEPSAAQDVDVEADTDIHVVAVDVPTDGSALRGTPLRLWIPGAPDLQVDLERGVTYNWVKTQRGGVAGHIGVCQVLDLVRATAAPELLVQDDAGYFEHRDVRILENKFTEFERILQALHRAMDQFNASPESERPKNFAEFMERLNRAASQTQRPSNVN